LPDVAARYLNDLTKRGSRYWAVCPFHSDSEPTNFNIYPSDDNCYRFYCFVCEAAGDVVDFISAIEGCSIADSTKRLSKEQLPNVGEFKRKKLPPSQSTRWKPILPVPESAPAYDPKNTFNPERNKVVNYERIMERLDAYRGEKGELLFYVIRIKFSDKKMTPVITFCEGPDGERRWAAKRMNEPYPIMGLDELKARPEANVILVSGEKCKAELSAVSKTYVVISWLGGDKAIAKTDWIPIVGRKIYAWPDADNPGNLYMHKLSKIVDEIEKAGTG
jgi:hypothetical protein